MLVLLSPGQGSQTPGLLTPWLDLPGASERLAHWSSLTGLDLLPLGTTASEGELQDTAVTQPLLAAAALLSARALLGAAAPAAVCGHSIGELPALAIAGVLDDDTAIGLAAERGAAMARAAAVRPTGMSAVLGGDAEGIETIASRLGLAVATVNAAGQTVLGGPVEALQELAASPPPRTRVRPLAVAGAFHTEAMQPAVERLAALVADIEPGAPRCAVIANADGAVVGAAGGGTPADGRDALDRLVAQLTGPVRFDLCLTRLRELGAGAVVELAPGGTLAALAKRALPGVPVVALRTPDDLDAARALLPEPVRS